jgi:hypothetical protein
MTDENSAEDPAQSGELIRRGAPPTPAPRTAKHRTIDRLLSMLSIWPFRNKAFARSLETAQEVMEKQTKLEETIVGHGKTRGKLLDLETILTQDHLQRRRELLEEQRRLSVVVNETMLDGEMMEQKNKMQMEELKRQEREQRLERMEQEKREMLLVKELEELRKPPPEPAAQPDKRKLREEAYKHFDKEVIRIDKMKNVTAERKTDLKNAARSDLEKELEKIDRMP